MRVLPRQWKCIYFMLESVVITTFMFMKVRAWELHELVNSLQHLFVLFRLLYPMNAVRYLSPKMTVEVTKGERRFQAETPRAKRF